MNALSGFFRPSHFFSFCTMFYFKRPCFVNKISNQVGENDQCSPKIKKKKREREKERESMNVLAPEGQKALDT